LFLSFHDAAGGPAPLENQPKQSSTHLWPKYSSKGAETKSGPSVLKMLDTSKRTKFETIVGLPSSKFPPSGTKELSKWLIKLL
jgi:hypothetical protein